MSVCGYKILMLGHLNINILSVKTDFNHCHIQSIHPILTGNAAFVTNSENNS